MDKDATIYEIINAHLDRGYRRSAGKMLLQIKSLSTNPASDMIKSLNVLDDEVDRLVEAKEPITTRNKEYKKAMTAYLALLVATAGLISKNAQAIQSSGQSVAPQSVTARVFIDVTDKLIKSGINPMSSRALTVYQNLIKESGSGFTIPSARYLSTQKALDYLNTGAWKEKMMRWGSGYYERTYNIFENGMANGWSPKYTAARLREVANNIPYSAAESLTRTLQLNAYRAASLETEAVNGAFIERKLWICTIDSRTCLTCLAKHGTEIPLGEDVTGHYRCRCSSYYVLPGGDEHPPFMQVGSTPGNRKFQKFQTGEEWFASLPPDRQAQQASFLNSPAKLRAYKDGLPLSSFVGSHTDPVFGNQSIELSLSKILGKSEAEQYYSINQTAGTIREGVTTVAQKNAIFNKSFSENITMSDLENRIISQTFETAGLYKDGIQLFEKDGSAHAVNFTNKDIKLMKGATLTHNHPSGANFSFDDIGIMSQNDIAEIRAVTKEFTFIMRNPIGKISEDDLYDNWDLAIGKVKEMKLNNPNMTVLEFNHLHKEEFAKLMEKYQLEYERIPR